MDYKIKKNKEDQRPFKLYGTNVIKLVLQVSKGLIQIKL